MSVDTRAHVTTVVRYLRPRLVRYVARRLTNTYGNADVAAVVDGAIARVWNAVHTRGLPLDLHAFLFRSTRNALIDYIRARPKDRVLSLEGLVGGQDDGTAIEALAYTPDLTTPIDVGRAVRALRPDDRAAVRAIYFDGLSIDAAAIELGVHASTIDRRLARASAALRVALA